MGSAAYSGLSLARNARQIVNGWIALRRDPKTHLYSRGRRWDWHNEAADHYSSLVLAARHLEPELIEPGGTLHATLQNAIRLCATPSGIPATYDLRSSTQGESTIDQHAEWLRDGLIRVVEVLGTDNDWYREMVKLTDAILAEAERRRLREIDAALARIEDRTYGVCQMTDKPIPKARLNAKPWARYTIEAAREIERGLGE